MNKDLDDIALRVLGCLMEKAATTPDAYPLSLNALTNACNQKSSRDPVMNLSEDDVRRCAEVLKEQGTVSTRSGAGNSRVTKYSHRLGKVDQLFEDGFSEDEIAVLCVLFLRGPQTLSEIKTRTQRLFGFADTDGVMATATRLEKHASGACVQTLARAPGQKEIRLMHLFGKEDVQPSADASPKAVEPATHTTTQQPAMRPQPDSESDRISVLEKKVEDLSAQVAELMQAARGS